MPFPESAKDFFFFALVKCCLFIEHRSFFVFETGCLWKVPQQFGLWPCFPLMSVRFFRTTITPKRSNQKTIRLKSRTSHCLNSPKEFGEYHICLQIFECVFLNMVKGQHNPSLGACWENKRGKVQPILQFKINALIRTSVITADKHYLLSL